MDEAVKRALETDRVIDITTKGRKSGQEHRIEIWFWNFDGRVYITGRPGRRSWFANLTANPDFTFHVKQSAQAELLARARPIHDEATRREVMERVVAAVPAGHRIEDWLERSPLVEVTFP